MSTRIKTLTEKTFQGKVTGYAVVLEDGISGNLVDKDSDKGLKAGDEVTATVKDYVAKSTGNHSNLITLKKVQQSAAQSTSFPTATHQLPKINQPGLLLEYKSQATIKAMQLMIDAFIADKVTWDQIKDKHKEITIYLTDAIDECSSE